MKCCLLTGSKSIGRFTHAEFQPTALRISNVEIPADAAAEDEAHLTECMLQVDVPLSEASSKPSSNSAR